MSSAICLNLDESKILSSGNGLTVDLTSQLLLFSPVLYQEIERLGCVLMEKTYLVHQDF